MTRPRRWRLPPRLDPEVLGGDLRDVVRHIDEALGDLAGGDGAPPGFDPRKFLAPGVPRVRPVLVLLSARAAGARRDDARAHESVAAATELLHLAIVLHDAALGRQGGRRRRAARRLIGGAVGVLGGNHLSLRALELVRQAPAPEMVGDLLDTMREIADGHALGQRLQGRLGTPEEALAFADGHTGAVFSFACRAGGRLAGAERPIVTSLGRYGRHTGIAWHLAEDLSALEADELAERAQDGRPSFTVGLAGQRDPDIAPRWVALSRDGDLDHADLLSRRLVEMGAVDEARRRLVQETWTARRALVPLEPSAYKDTLDRIVAGLA